MISYLTSAVLLVGLLQGSEGRESVVRGWRSGRGDNTGVLTTHKVKPDFCDDAVKSTSGYFHVNGTKNLNYFYWYFESRNDPENAPVIMWLTGGPGCSSVLALFAENGPCSVNQDGSGTTRNPYSWNNNANIFWIDQPAGVGFSYGDVDDYVNNEDDVAEDLYQFLQAFFHANPKLQNNDFFIFGESYGGHYAPATSYRVLKGNQNHEGLHINLAGVGVGNGLTDPEIQYQYYAQMAYNNTYGIQAVSKDAYDAMIDATPKCVQLIHQCQAHELLCGVADAYCNAKLAGQYSASGLNVYDVRIKCEVPGLCYNFDHIDKFLSTPEVLEALHVPSDAAQWQECNMDVNKAFKRDFLKNYQQTLPPLLESGVRVLIYAGDADFICNWYGNEAWTLALEWDGKQAFNRAPTRKWVADVEVGEAAGISRSASNFTFLRVFGAGHMVPMDQPAVALEMVNTFIAGQDFTAPATEA